jgi:PIN domain nuclease of toxin-antitoxin system
LRVLLDTHTLLWATLSPSFLSREAAAIIADERNVIYVSAASAWEIATKVRLGELPGAEVVERDFLEVMDHAGTHCFRSMCRVRSAPAGSPPNIAILSIA